jgi:succinoglycan biosynthesis transport protein ExoP
LLSPDKLTPRIDPSRDTGNEADFIDFDKLIAIARRQWRLVAAFAFAFAILGVVYVLTSVPVYTADTSVLIDRSDSQVINQLAAFGQMDDDEGTVLSQVELLKSDTIAYAVADKLKLVDNPEFMGPKNSLFSVATLKSFVNFRSWFADDVAVAPDPEMRRRGAAETVAGNIDVERVGRSYVLDVSYTSQSPDLARDIAAAIADVYLVDKLNSKYEATRRAGEWLQERIEELRQQALDTDLAVQKFRSEHGLVESGSGTLLSEQQLSELNSQLINAQAATAQPRQNMPASSRSSTPSRPMRSSLMCLTAPFRMTFARNISRLRSLRPRSKRVLVPITSRRFAFARKWPNMNGSCSMS